MILKHLELSHFRNHESLQINFDKDLMFFSGFNGAGKTNILEAIFFLSYAKSFRTSNASNLVQHDHTDSSIYAVYDDDFGIEHTICATPGKKKLSSLIIKRSNLFRQFLVSFNQ